MDNVQANKRREKLQIERFTKLLGYQDDDIRYPNEDPPDAVIETKAGLISLEHTRIVKEEDRPVETIRERCIRQAKAQWDKHKMPTVRVDILFNNLGPVAYKQIKIYSDRIYNLIFAFTGPLHDKKSRICLDGITCYVALSTQGSSKRWTCVENHVGWVKQITESRLQERISKKNSAIPRYRDKYHETWLLLFVESEYASSMFHIETRHEHESDFDRVFISDGFEYIEVVKRKRLGC